MARVETATRGCSRPILAFAHIQKTGGQTIVYLLRRHFGLRHIDVLARGFPDFYRPRDLDLDSRVMFPPMSLGGHSLRPCVNYGKANDRLVWFTMLRDPVRRYISQYFYNVEAQRQEIDVLGYLNDVHMANRQVRRIAGEENIDKARQLLRRMRFVGLTEHYRESLILLRDRLDLEEFDINYGNAKNVSLERDGSIDRQKIMKIFKENIERVRAANNLDIELYEFARREIWPKQTGEHGEARLTRDVESEFSREPSRRAGHKVNLSLAFLRRNLLYKPWVRADRLMGHYSPYEIG